MQVLIYLISLDMFHFCRISCSIFCHNLWKIYYCESVNIFIFFLNNLKFPSNNFKPPWMSNKEQISTGTKDGNDQWNPIYLSRQNLNIISANSKEFKWIISKYRQVTTVQLDIMPAYYHQAVSCNSCWGMARITAKHFTVHC